MRRGHKGGHSFAPPFLCGIAGAIACLVCPWPGVWQWAWLPPLLDLSILLLLVCAVLHVVARPTGLRSPFDARPPRPTSLSGIPFADNQVCRHAYKPGCIAASPKKTTPLPWRGG